MKKDSLEKIGTILKAEIEKNDLHCIRIQEALLHLKHILPLSQERVNNLTYEEISSFALLTERFIKLQDSIGEKIFVHLLVMLRERTDGKSFIDILNKLEQLEILENVAYWDKMRKVRNNLTHEYPNNPEVTITGLKDVIFYAQELCNYWKKLKEIIIHKIK